MRGPQSPYSFGKYEFTVSPSGQEGVASIVGLGFLENKLDSDYKLIQLKFDKHRNPDQVFALEFDDGQKQISVPFSNDLFPNVQVYETWNKFTLEVSDLKLKLSMNGQPLFDSNDYDNTHPEELEFIF